MTITSFTPQEFANKLFEHIVDPLLAAMAFTSILLLIVVGIKFIKNADSLERGKLFKSLAMVVFGIFVIFSIWTIVTFVGRLAESDINPQRDIVEFETYRILTR